MNRSLPRELIREEVKITFDNKIRTLENEIMQLKEEILQLDYQDKRLEAEKKSVEGQLERMLESVTEPIFYTFNVKCKKKLSTTARKVLLSWNSKQFYHANEDILYICRSKPSEQDFLLKILHSMVIFLQNSTCTSFFNIRIHNVIITPTKSSKISVSSKGVETITFKLSCRVTPPTEKLEISWY